MVKGFKTRLIVPLAFVGCSIGCSPPRLQEMKQYADIQAGKQTVLLIRVTAEQSNGKTATNAVTLGFGIGDFDTGGELEPAYPGQTALFLSNESAGEGWVYFILKPGAHYLGFLGQRVTSAFSYYGHLKTAQRWSIDIPEGSRLIYGGTVHLLCRRFTFLFETTCLQQQQVGVVNNEETLAAEVASKHLTELGPPRTLLLQPHRGGPIIINKPQ